MWPWPQIVWAIASTAGVASLLFFAYQILVHPARAWSVMRVDRDRRTIEKTLIYANMALRFFTLWAIFYHGLYAAFGWMPENWGSETEDGYTTTRDGVSGMLSLIAAGAVTMFAGTLVQLRVNEAQKD